MLPQARARFAKWDRRGLQRGPVPGAAQTRRVPDAPPRSQGSDPPRGRCWSEHTTARADSSREAGPRPRPSPAASPSFHYNFLLKCSKKGAGVPGPPPAAAVVCLPHRGARAGPPAGVAAALGSGGPWERSRGLGGQEDHQPDPDGLQHRDRADFISTRAEGAAARRTSIHPSRLCCMWLFLTTEFGFVFLLRLIFQQFSYVLLTSWPCARPYLCLTPRVLTRGGDGGLGVGRAGGVPARAPCLPQPQWTWRSSHAGSTRLQLVCPRWGH